MTATVLVVDDEKNIRRTLRMVLEGEGLSVRDVERAEDAKPLLSDGEVDLVLCDVRLPGISGIELLQWARKEPSVSAIPFLMISGHASVSDAVEAVRLGATDFFEKPLDRDRVLVSVRNALARVKLERKVAALEARVGVREELLGDAPAMRKLFSEIERIAPTKARVLVLGESGTGKELVARAIHRLSPRAEQPFVKVNCAAIPAELVESELFGHEKGAFTGAIARKRGHFEAAHGGTLFLDEIGDMPLHVQAKVLRALQQGEITRVGSDAVQMVDVRVIAATHRDLETEVAKGTFREDLFFRLSVLPLKVPPLRERPEDIVTLALAFVKQCCDEHGFKRKEIAPPVLDELAARPFPGNVRELRNLVERMVILSGDRIELGDLPEEPRLSRELRARMATERGASSATTSSPPTASQSFEAADDDDADDYVASVHVAREPGSRLTLREFRDQAERDYIVATLREVDFNISRAATILGIERTNLHKKMRALGVKRDD
ncbi:MAG: sigma-54-dependent Fis family transcriptional regulator [Myxococcales bacterium]|nr:sigma-54-dependent Fis family transcriptional regulator [Myxococcales bacterium]